MALLRVVTAGAAISPLLQSATSSSGSQSSSPYMSMVPCPSFKQSLDVSSMGSSMWSSVTEVEMRNLRDCKGCSAKSARMGRAMAGGVEETAAAAEGEAAPGSGAIHGRCFVVGDNIDTDQIIPAEYLTLVPSKPEEYEKLGSYAMIGLPAHWGRFIEEGKLKTEYKVVIGGANFGCGSSREHAPVAMGAAGVRAVVAESYARIFFRNSVATGELYPVETEGRICEENHTGDYVTVDMEHNVLVNHTTGKQYPLKPIGEAGPVIDAGGIFAYARSTGMIAAPAL